MRLSQTEENYLKAIYQLAEEGNQLVTTSALASSLGMSPAAITDMVQRLYHKGFLTYQKYQGVNLSPLGKEKMLQLLRRQRLWEVFLVKKLKLGWDEISEAIEELEHIQSELLIQRLDDYLENPTHSPRGTPIPNKNGFFQPRPQYLLSQLEAGQSGTIVAVKDGAAPFLQYLNKKNIYLGATVKVLEKIAFDQTMDISIDGGPNMTISERQLDYTLQKPTKRFMHDFLPIPTRRTKDICPDAFKNTDAIQHIVGPHAQVTALMGPGVDPHAYKASPKNIKQLSQADLIFYNGLHLEGKMADILKKFNNQKLVYAASDGLDPHSYLGDPQYKDGLDPHFWFDILLWKKAVAYMSTQLQAADPQAAVYYQENTLRYLAELDTLHEATQKALKTIPKNQRILITAHDAFTYFGKAYDIEVRGLQGISTVGECGLWDITNLVELIIQRQVKAIFPENSVPNKPLKAVIEGCKQRGHNVVLGQELYSDALGAIGSPEGTYIGMVNTNIQHLSVSYAQKPVLWDINLELPAGKVIGIIGPNGAGKSTFIKSMMGLIPIDSGMIEIFGQSLKKVRKRIGYVPQRNSVDWDFPASVFDVVLMGRYAHLGLFQRPRPIDKEIAMHALAQVEMQHLAKRQIGQLSGGQQQRIFLARALAQEADLYFMDEPFIGVDAATEKSIITLLQALANQGKSIIVVHHDLQTATQYFDWCVLLNLRLIGAGPTPEILTPTLLQATYGGRLTILSEVGNLMQNTEFPIKETT
eukprot:gene237-316_t